MNTKFQAHRVFRVQRFWTFFSLIVIGAILLTACGGPTPTATFEFPTRTGTATPTLPSIPSLTPSPTPTATPDAAILRVLKNFCGVRETAADGGVVFHIRAGSAVVNGKEFDCDPYKGSLGFPDLASPTPVPEVSTKLKEFEGEYVTLRSCQRREDTSGVPYWIYEVETSQGKELARTGELVSFASAFVSDKTGVTYYELRYELDTCDQLPIDGILAYSIHGFEPTILEIYAPTREDKEVDKWFVTEFEPAYSNMEPIGEWEVGLDYFRLWGHARKCESMLELAWITDWTSEEFGQLARLCLGEEPKADRALEWSTRMNERYNYIGTESNWVIDDTLIVLTFAKQPPGSRLQGVLSPGSDPIRVRQDVTVTVSVGEGAAENLYMWPWTSYDWLKVDLSDNPFGSEVINGGYVAFLTSPEYQQYMRPCCYDSPSISDIPRGLKVWQVKADQ